MIPPLQNNKRSSTKPSCPICSFPYLGWQLKYGSLLKVFSNLFEYYPCVAQKGGVKEGLLASTLFSANDFVSLPLTTIAQWTVDTQHIAHLTNISEKLRLINTCSRKTLSMESYIFAYQSSIYTQVRFPFSKIPSEVYG